MLSGACFTGCYRSDGRRSVHTVARGPSACIHAPQHQRKFTPGVVTRNGAGRVEGMPFSRFLCYTDHIIIYDEPESKTEVPVRIYRAKDGSLVLAQEHVDAGAVFVSLAPRKWFRFQEVPAKPQPAVQGRGVTTLSDFIVRLALEPLRRMR